MKRSIIILLLVALLLTGCGNTKEKVQEKENGIEYER